MADRESLFGEEIESALLVLAPRHVTRNYTPADAAADKVRRELRRVESDLARHLDSISGEDGGLAEHGECAICDWQAR